jgi:hypothetical protein
MRDMLRAQAPHGHAQQRTIPGKDDAQQHASYIQHNMHHNHIYTAEFIKALERKPAKLPASF